MGKRRVTTTGRDRFEPGNEPSRYVKPSGSKPKDDKKKTKKPYLNRNKALVIIISSTTIVLLLLLLLSSVYYYNFVKNNNKMDTSTKSGLSLTTHLTYLHVLSENSKVLENESQRHFTNPVLAYVTPWNSKGYDMAKRFNSKFSHISPVWYDLKSQATDLVLEGRHNADRGWISELRKAGNAKILPRVVLEASPAQLLKKKKQRRKVIDLIVAECKEMEFDGIVLESWSRWAAFGVLHDPEMRKMALEFVKQLGQALHGVRLEGIDLQNLELVYVIGPPHGAKLQPYDFGPEDLKSLGDDVDGFSLMTYDYSSPQNPGPNAPLKWVRSTLGVFLNSTSNDAQSVVNKKIFVGINFYGNDFSLSEDGGGGAITGRDYLSLLQQHKPSFQWEKDSEEHFFIYSDSKNTKHAVFYPSQMSISRRLDEASSWGAGISIWELGQGLDYFFHIL